MKLINLTKATVVAKDLSEAQGFRARMVGLIGKSSLSSEEALLIPHCRSIHMVFMRFPIDVIFISTDYRVVGLVRNIHPFRLSPVFWKASFAVEGAVGMIERSKTEIDDSLEIH